MTMFSDQNSQIASHELFVLLIVIIILFSRQFSSVSLSVVSMPPWQSWPWCKVKKWTVRQLSNVCRSVADTDDGDDDVITLLIMTVAVAKTNSWSLVSGKNEQFNGQRQGRTLGHRSTARTNTWSSVNGKDEHLVIGHRQRRTLGHRSPARTNTWSSVIGKDEHLVIGHRQRRTLGHRSPAKTNTWSSVTGSPPGLPLLSAVVQATRLVSRCSCFVSRTRLSGSSRALSW